MISVKYLIPNDPSGYGQANRMDITALWTAGVNVTVEPIKQMSEQSDYGIAGDLVKRLTYRDIPYKIKITHTTPDLIPDYKEDGIYHIQRLAWETDKLPREWVKPLNSCDEIWVMTEPQIEMVRNSGVSTPCYVFAQPIDTTIANEKIRPFELNHPRDFIFYSCFQWIPRKNPRGLLHAYWKEFEGNDKVTLLLKTYRITYIEKEYQIIRAEIEQWRKELKQKHFPKIYLTHKVLSDQEMMRFHMTGDVFVNSSSGEGWGRPTQEAMLLGKPVITTTNGGITDTMSSLMYHAVTSGVTPVTVSSEIPWYQAGMSWWELNESSLRKQMRTLYEQKGESDKTKLAQQFVIDNFSFQKIGQQMRERLESI